MVILLHEHIELTKYATTLCTLACFDLLKHKVKVATSCRSFAALLGLKVPIGLQEILSSDIRSQMKTSMRRTLIRPHRQKEKLLYDLTAAIETGRSVGQAVDQAFWALVLERCEVFGHFIRKDYHVTVISRRLLYRV